MKYIKLLLVFVIVLSTLGFAGCGPDRTLTISITPNNGGTVSPNGGIFKNGAEVTLVATPANNYEFNGWAGDIPSSTDRITIKMNSDKNVVASFKKRMVSLQLSVSPSGSGILDPNNGSYEAGSQVKITATPVTGYRFDQWGGGATGTARQISIVMDKDKIITASFIRQYMLKLSSNPSEGGTVSQSSGLYDSGTQVNLTATQVFPYIFSNWTGTDNDSVYKTTVTMNSDKTVTCNFTKGNTTPDFKSETFPVYRGGSYSFPIDLNQFEYAEGSIAKATSPASIQDPTGTTIKDFGAVSQSNFTITALIPGRYTIIFYNNDQGALSQSYTVKYRIYKR